MGFRALSVAVFLAFLAFLSPVRAGDLIFPPADTTLRIETGELTRIPLADPLATGRIVWVLPYTLINEGDSDRTVTVSFSMSTDARRLVELPAPPDEGTGPGTLASRHVFSPVKVPAADVPEARRKIGEILGTRFLSNAEMQGTIRAGERKTAAAVFSGVPVDVHTLQVNVFGLAPVERIRVRTAEKTFRRGTTNPEMLKRFLSVGIPVVRLAPEPHGDGIEFLPLVKKLTAREYGAIARKEGVAFERDGAYYEYADPLFQAADGETLRQEWVLRITFERVNEAARGVADYTIQTDRSWIIGLSEDKPPQ